MLVVFGTIKSSEVYQQALDTAGRHPQVVAALGEPIEPGWFPGGSIEVSGSAGRADLSIPISGPNGSGTIYAVAYKEAGQWLFNRLEVAVEGRPDRIELLEPQ